MNRAVIVTTQATYLGGGWAPTPARVLELGAVDFIASCWSMLGNEDGTVLIGAVLAKNLGLPTGELPSGDDAKGHPVAKDLRTNGYGVKEVHRWTHITRGTRTLHVGLLEFINDDYMTIKGETAMVTARALDGWYRLIRTPWTGDTGDAINTLIRETGRYKIKEQRNKIVEPQWWDKGPHTGFRERAYAPSQWSRTEDAPYELGFDKVRAYLSAWTVTEVAAKRLRRTGRIAFDRKQAGWWLVRPAEWKFADRMPDPAGYGTRDDDGCVWLTTPRLVLLDELVRSEHHGGFEVFDSWTAEGKSEIIKPAAERMRDAWEAMRGDESAEAGLIRTSIKEGYRMAGGKWCSPQSDIERSDWLGAVTAMSAANTWRKAWEIGTSIGVWPLRIDTDNLWYASKTADHKTMAQTFSEALDRGDGKNRFELADRLGCYRTGGTRETKCNVSRETEDA